MSDTNLCMFSGRVGAEPELKATTKGHVLNFRMACSRKYNGKEETEWINVIVFDKRAEGLATILEKGRQVFVEGRLQTQKYEKDGQTKYFTKILANNVVLGAKPGQEKYDGPAEGTPTNTSDNGNGPNF